MLLSSFSANLLRNPGLYPSPFTYKFDFRWIEKHSKISEALTQPVATAAFQCPKETCGAKDCVNRSGWRSCSQVLETRLDFGSLVVSNVSVHDSLIRLSMIVDVWQIIQKTVCFWLGNCRLQFTQTHNPWTYDQQISNTMQVGSFCGVKPVTNNKPQMKRRIMEVYANTMQM